MQLMQSYMAYVDNMTNPDALDLYFNDTAT